MYERHHIYKKINDYQLSSMVYRLLFIDKKLKNQQCLVEITVFNGDILISGHVPSADIKELIAFRLHKLSGYRAIYNEITINTSKSNQLLDSWITAKIRSKIITNSQIAPSDFKITTTDAIVYIMGDIKANQASQVIAIVQNTNGVRMIVKLIHYYYLK